MKHTRSPALKIRSATEADLPRLTELAWASKAHWGYPASWLEVWRDELEFTPACLQAWDVRCAVIAGRVQAVCAIGFEVVDGAQVAEVEALWVSPSAMGQGLGRCLIEHALTGLSERGCRELVIVSDPNAQGFYRKLGARPAGCVPSRPQGRRLPRMVLPIP